uniref:Uncharacterized protein n=1 Tax=Globisporangium ultimum (strain ATCC 200006 / CBS 805.95 / DAOM BR144) TaxID=431595 RepID=K3WXV3_GLOUD
MDKVSAVQSYLSQIKSYFDIKWQDNVEWILHPSRSNDKWYSDIRSGIKRRQCIATLRQICAMLVANNASTSLKERDLLVTQWYCMGRTVETGLRHSSMKFVPKPIVGRSKSNVYQHVHAFCDRESWEADIFHAKASYLATCANVDDEFQFRNVTAKMINTILSNVCGQAGAEELSKFTSHSGGVGVHPRHSHITASALSKSSREGGWPETDKGGTPPNANSLTEVDRTSFRALALELYKQYLSFYDASILEVLTASLVMYYNDVKHKWAKMDREDVLLLLASIEAAACREFPSTTSPIGQRRSAIVG